MEDKQTSPGSDGENKPREFVVAEHEPNGKQQERATAKHLGVENEPVKPFGERLVSEIEHDEDDVDDDKPCTVDVVFRWAVVPDEEKHHRKDRCGDTMEGDEVLLCARAFDEQVVCTPNRCGGTERINEPDPASAVLVVRVVVEPEQGEDDV